MSAQFIVDASITLAHSCKKISGNLNQPKWGHLKQLHAAIKSGQKVLTTSSSSTKQFSDGVDVGDQIEPKRFTNLFKSQVEGVTLIHFVIS